MSRFNRKGWKTARGLKEDGTIAPFPVKVGGYHDTMNAKAARKFKRERQKAFRAYKDNLREQKKKVPLAERSKVNWSAVPEKFL